MDKVNIQSKRNSLDHAVLILQNGLHSPNGGMQIELEWLLMNKGFTKECTHTSIAYMGGEPVGSAMLLRDYAVSPPGTPFRHLLMVFIKPKFRNNGVAIHLIKSVLKHGDANKREVFAYPGFNLKSQNFWAKSNIFWCSPTDPSQLPPSELIKVKPNSERSLAAIHRAFEVPLNQASMQRQGFGELIPSG